MPNDYSVTSLSANPNDKVASAPSLSPVARCIALMACELFFFIALISVSAVSYTHLTLPTIYSV